MEERKKIAQWLYDKIMAENYVYQSSVVQEIANEFGEQYTYSNDNGNPAIDRGVLYEFGKLKGNDILWDRQSLSWHIKTDGDRVLERLTDELVTIDMPAVEIDLPEVVLSDFEIE